MQIIKNEHLVIEINEYAAELHSIKDKAGNEYLWQGDEKYWARQAPNLFPFVGRFTNGEYQLNGKIYNMGIHGFARVMDFEPVRISERQIMFCLEASEETLLQYPYKFSFYILYSLSGNQLSVLYHVVNHSEDTMYFGLGGHPGFCVPLEEGLNFEDYYLEFDEVAEVKQIGMSEDCFVNGEIAPFELSDGMKLPLRHSLFDNDAIILTDMSRAVTLKSDIGKNFVRAEYPDMSYLGLWHCPKKEAPYVCIEPWTSLPSRKGIVEDFATHPSMLSLAAGKTYLNQMNFIFGGE